MCGLFQGRNVSEARNKHEIDSSQSSAMFLYITGDKTVHSLSYIHIKSCIIFGLYIYIADTAESSVGIKVNYYPYFTIYGSMVLAGNSPCVLLLPIPLNSNE